MKKAGIVSIPMAALAMVALLASCSPQPATSTTTPGGNTTTTPPTGATTTTPAQSGNPQYGGTLTVVNPGDILAFDEGTNAVFFTISTHLTNDELLTGDWTKGPQGSGQYTWLSNGTYSWNSKAPSIAESWEIVAPGHMVFHIRKGVHFGLNPNSEASRLVNGRELTGQDVLYSLNRMATLQGSYWISSAPAWTKSLKLTLTDPWTLDATCTPAEAYNFATYLVDWGSIIPKEVVDKYGDLKDWHNAVGSGPFFLTDFVSNSSATFIKNKNYWGTDPIGPGKGNKLPYVDQVKMLIISDPSTQQAALRTAKIDTLGGQTYDNAQTIRNTIKGLNELSYVPQNPNQIWMHTDKQDLPYKDIRVRQALTMGLDYKSIMKELMGNEASLPSWPLTPMPDFINAYLPLDQAPQAVKDIYTYNPQKAKQMLADAGYPNGFKASIIYNNTDAFAADYLPVVKDMWSKINVDLDLQPVDFGVSQSRWAGRSYDNMLWGLMPSAGTYWRCLSMTSTGAGQNLSFVNDPKVIAARDQMVAAFILGDDATVEKVHKDLMAYVLEQAWVIPTPVQNLHTFWWPWLKGYKGEQSPGIINEFQWTKYVWLDQNLKTQMGH